MTLIDGDVYFCVQGTTLPFFSYPCNFYNQFISLINSLPTLIHVQLVYRPTWHDCLIATLYSLLKNLCTGIFIHARIAFDNTDNNTTIQASASLLCLVVKVRLSFNANIKKYCQFDNSCLKKLKIRIRHGNMFLVIRQKTIRLRTKLIKLCYFQRDHVRNKKWVQDYTM